jgi:hypothetical protein
MISYSPCTKHAIIHHDYPQAVETARTPSAYLRKRRYFLHIDMLLSAVSVLVVVKSSEEIPEGLINNFVYSALLATDKSVKQRTINKQHQIQQLSNYQTWKFTL